MTALPLALADTYATVAPATTGRLRMLCIGDIQLDLDGIRLFTDGQQIHVPLKEFQLLHALMRNAGKVQTRRQLLDQVWGSDYPGTNKTLEVHIRRIRGKIEADMAHPTHIRTVRSIGYIFDFPDDATS